MGKFVTYGVTEMLDNDQKFIIDSDRTGPGSITAKDAASSFLSKWAGFDTFEEAVQNTISNNQEFIDRDAAIRNETAELKKKIVTTFPAKDASGAVATFESEFEDAPLKSCIVRVEPVQDLHGYDHPWPAGGGVNKCPNVGWAQGQIQYDGHLSSATPYAISSDYILLDPGTYTLSRIYNNTPGAGQVAYHSYDMEKTHLSDSSWRPNPWTFDITEPTYIRLTTRYDTSTDLHPSDIDGFVKIQLELGSTATAWTPYENLCPITGWTEVGVEQTGKNLCMPSLYSISGENIIPSKSTVTIDEDEYVFTPSGTNEDVFFGAMAFTLGNVPKITGNTFVEEGETYTATVLDAESKFNKNFIQFMDKDNKLVSNQTGAISIRFGKSVTFTVPQGVKHIGFRIGSESLSAGNTYKVKIQLELGSTPTSYEPYTGQTYPITFPTEAGIVYGAYVDVTGGELVVNRASEEFSFVNPSTSNGLDSKIFTLANASTQATSENGKTTNVIDNYVYAGASHNAPHFYIVNKTFVIYLKENTYRGGTVQICYPLAEPIRYPLTPTEIKTLLGTNNVWSNTGDTAVEYLMSDVSWYVKKKLRAFQSILAGVEDSAVASKNYSTDSYLIFNDDIYRVTKTITAGETIEEGVNVTKTTVAEQLMALAQA